MKSQSALPPLISYSVRSMRPYEWREKLDLKICRGVPLDGASCVSAKQVSWEIPSIHKDAKAKEADQ